MTLKQKMVQTNEDWYPSYFETSDTGETLSMVKVSLYKLGKGRYRVSVWGNDDFGVERDFFDLTEAGEYYRRIPRLIKRQKLINDGFIPA